MTEIRRAGADSGDLGTAHRAQHAASTRMSNEAHDLLVTDFRGRACRTQPSANEIPIQNNRSNRNGCSFADGGPTSENPLPPFNAGDLYRTNLQNVAHVRADVANNRRPDRSVAEMTGTGFAVLKDNNTCYVATNEHVVVPGQNLRTNGLRVTMSNGQTFAGNVVEADKNRDLALIAVQTGAETSRVCSPRAVAETAYTHGPAFVMGFPEGAINRPYLSPATLRGTVQVTEGRGRNRHTQELIFGTATIRSGNSGSPVYAPTGKIIGTANSGDARNVGIVGMTAEDARRWQRIHAPNAVVP